MTHAEALAAHIASNPGKPPLDLPMSEYRPLMLVYERWLFIKGKLEIAARLEGIHIEIGERQQPTCAPRADYEWRDMPARKTTRPAWSGATKEYNQQKQAERRARVRAAVLEVQAERKGRVA